MTDHCTPCAILRIINEEIDKSRSQPARDALIRLKRRIEEEVR